ncbi:MAG: DUF839 domain-containing protein [Phycisphaerales bacterium]|nr:DUF839 domain-containing protein [Phycisphaerales bacterium]
MAVSRRDFLWAASSITLGFSGLARLALAFRSDDVPPGSGTVPGYGPLRPDPEGLFDLPAGFSYRVISRVGDEMVDGLRVPGLPDAMATFPGPGGQVILLCNHELDAADHRRGPFGPQNHLFKRVDAALLFDAGRGRQPCLGGTTTLVWDSAQQRVIRQYLSLAGTERNCAGGPTPWGTWITCEETVRLADDNYEHNHGYNFEVPARAEVGLARATPLRAMGRFNHEAVAVSPETGIVYQTEDRSDGLLYRFLPRERGRLNAGGILQVLAVRDRAGLDTRNWEEATIHSGTPLAVRWLAIDEIEAPRDDLRLRGHAAGAARFARGEGMWWGEREFYFACTNGGQAKAGQLWRYRPSAAEGTPEEDAAPPTVELFCEPNDRGLIDNADNLTIAPWGDVILCEDGQRPAHLVGVTPAGGIYTLGRNALSNSELAGATFSPDGATLFLNIQHDGLTLAITGPWAKRG